jgi:CheY-like chemotaxis protein
MSSRKKSVLIVDDEPSIRDSVSRILQKRGYHVASARNGNEALEMTPIFKPDVVLLDIIMPGIDGYEVCRHLKTACPEVKVIYFTAKVELRDISEDCREIDLADAVIEKPANSEAILTAIEQVLAG